MADAGRYLRLALVILGNNDGLTGYSTGYSDGSTAGFNSGYDSGYDSTQRGRYDGKYGLSITAENRTKINQA